MATSTVVKDPVYPKAISEGWSRALAREIYWSGRDLGDYECPDCGRGESRVYDFEVHHKDGDPFNNHPSNLIGLCRRCHIWRHRSSTLSGLDVIEWKSEFGGIGGKPA